MAPVALKDFLQSVVALIEGRPQGDWSVEFVPVFLPSVEAFKRQYPDVGKKVADFIALKKSNPLMLRFGKYDRPMTGPGLKGAQHCHLYPDAVLIYTLSGGRINLVEIVRHADTEGRRMNGTAKRLADYLK